MRVKPVRPRRRADITPRLWPPWLAIGTAGLVAVLGAIGIYLLITALVGLPWHSPPDTPEGREQRKLLVETFKAALGIAAGIGAVVALAVAYRRHRIEESQSHRDDQRLFTERFGSAAEQLGHDQPALRLAGVHAMARLADDWDEQRQTCIDVLCAYLRLPLSFVESSSESPDNTDAAAAVTPTARSLAAEREVRQTIGRLIADHLRIDPNDTTRIGWHGQTLDFTNAVFDGSYDFGGAQFSGGEVSFIGAKFSREVRFRGAQFSGGLVSFARAEFSGGRVSFDGARVSGGGVSFDSAQFSGGEVSFNGAQFSGGEVSFDGAQFSGGEVSFDSAQFSGGEVSFDGAQFSGGAVSFVSAQFSGGEVRFRRAPFSGGEVSFNGAQFSGGEVSLLAEFSGCEVSFDAAKFSDGQVRFGDSVFSGGQVSFSAQFSGGEVSFIDAEFSGGEVSFRFAEFSGGLVSFGDSQFSGGEVSFIGAEFSGGEVSFIGAEFSGGTVDLRRPASWDTPPQFDEAAASTPGLGLPPVAT